MKKKFATLCFIIGTVVAPIAVHAADGDSDRSHPLTFVKDSVITTKVKAKLADEKMTSLVHISVDTDNHGIVYLSGTARSQESINKAIEIARGTEGVTSVQSTLTIKKDD